MTGCRLLLRRRQRILDPISAAGRIPTAASPAPVELFIFLLPRRSRRAGYRLALRGGLFLRRIRPVPARRTAASPARVLLRRFRATDFGLGQLRHIGTSRLCPGGLHLCVFGLLRLDRLRLRALGRFMMGDFEMDRLGRLYLRTLRLFSLTWLLGLGGEQALDHIRLADAVGQLDLLLLRQRAQLLHGFSIERLIIHDMNSFLS